MFWLKLLFIGVSVLCTWYVMGFDDNEERKDERGLKIQLKRNNTLYGLLFVGITLLISLNIAGVISTQHLPDILLWFVLSLNVFGAALTYFHKHRAIG
ncbi:hypothetical protein [Bacillus xiapuensis]|uniref:hypothetical protein n=1 Tax=Bacillus xiapuensis TaxID=2014075 RepID=UPI000C2348F6|nr:hypothetical protein [Bacillus xiapuensis]